MKIDFRFFLTLFFLATGKTHAAVIFEENFDAQSDWYSLTKIDIGPLPDNWDFGRTNEFWHPDFGDLNSNPSMLISGLDPAKVYGSLGKAFITYSESVYPDAFASDGFLTKDVEPTNELYVEFQLKFQTGFAEDHDRGIVKIFRALHFDGGTEDDRIDFFADGKSAPIYLYEWNQNDFGVRHLHGFRCDEQSLNYFCEAPEVLNPPRRIARGDMSMNYTSDLAVMPQPPSLIDQETNLELVKDGVVFHNKVFGDNWHKLGFYVKLNSAPGVQDGVLMHWLDDQLILDVKTVPWIGDSGDINAKWNSFSIGGNDYTKFNLNDADHISLRERWFAIDNILVIDIYPIAPNPPVNLRVIRN